MKMAEIIRLRNSPHDEAQELLPWLVNGTLDREETERVEAHLAECAECRAELEAERRLASAVASTALDCDSGWEAMQRRLEGEPAARPAPPPLWRRRIPVGWAVASPLAVAAALALIFVNVTPRQPVQGEYRALGAAPVAQPANVVVQFAPATKLADMQGALQLVDARLVDGPTATGAYLLHVDQNKRELALKELRDNKAIALAEPIDQPARE
jgi:anti-sigma factor RsiW